MKPGLLRQRVGPPRRDESLERALHYADLGVRPAQDPGEGRLQSARPWDDGLVRDLWRSSSAETDYCIFYRKLADVPLVVDAPEQLQVISDAYYDQGLSDSVEPRRSVARAGPYAPCATTDDARVARMKGANPKYVMRNYLAQLAIEQAEDYTGVSSL